MPSILKVLEHGFPAVQEYVQKGYLEWAEKQKVPGYLRPEGLQQALNSIPYKLEETLSDLLFAYGWDRRPITIPHPLSVKNNKVYYEHEPELFRRVLDQQEIDDAATVASVCDKLSGLTGRYEVGRLMKELFPEGESPKPTDADSILIAFQKPYVKKYNV